MQLSCSTLTSVARLPQSKQIAVKELSLFNNKTIQDSILCIANNDYLFLDDSEVTYKMHEIAKLLASQDTDLRLFKQTIKQLIKTGVLIKIIRFMCDSDALSVQEQSVWIIKKIMKFSGTNNKI